MIGGRALASINRHVSSETDREVGGVLLGPPSSEGPVSVQSSVQAVDAHESRGSLTFTQDSWTHIYEELDSLPGMVIVGWYHSHPDFGIFLSEQDLFIHRNFFSDPRQIALVLDPIRNEHGVFSWDGPSISRMQPAQG